MKISDGSSTSQGPNPVETDRHLHSNTLESRALGRGTALAERRLMNLAFPALATALTLSLVPGCMVGEDEALDGTAGVSIAKGDNRLRGCKGVASKAIPDDGRYLLTTFGGPGDHQSMSCGGYADGTTWYAASRQRYGCGTKLRVEANGKCAVVTALDYGPDVCVETAGGAPILDASPLVGKHLFGESGVGYSDKLAIKVTPVAPATKVGPCVPGGTPDELPPDDPTGGTTAGTCSSATLDRDVEAGVCVQNATDAKWYECDGGAWVSRASSAGCTEAYGFCNSATLGKKMPPRTCVQAASNGTWYQCNGQGWVSPVSVSAGEGPIGDCSTMHPL